MISCVGVLWSCQATGPSCNSRPRAILGEVIRKENSSDPGRIQGTGHACVGEGTRAPLSLHYQDQSDLVRGLLPPVLSLPRSFQGGLHLDRSRTKPGACPAPVLLISVSYPHFSNFENGTTSASSNSRVHFSLEPYFT